jgi:hypothetical protein
MMHQRLFSLGRRSEQIAMREPNRPKRVSQLAHAFSNEFELPVLSYVLTILHNPPRRSDRLGVGMDLCGIPPADSRTRHHQ